MSNVAILAGDSALGIARSFVKGNNCPVELTEYLINSIEKQSSPIFLKVTKKRALREAQAARCRLKDGKPLSPLDGVPIAWKDLIDIEGEKTTAGSNIYRNSEPAERDAPIVANATAAGMINLGKVNLTEFAFSGLGLNPHFGTPVNPHDTTTPRSPGGSSSGSAAAVAHALCPCAIGTDTGGSVRIPASFNGIVGYKSSEKRIDKSGVFALSPTLDTVGPLARSVSDCAALDAILRRHSFCHNESSSVADMHFFVAQGVTLDGLEKSVADNFERSLKALESAGAKIITGSLEPLERAAQLAEVIGTITAAEAYQIHQTLFETGMASLIDRHVVARILIGKGIGKTDLKKLHGERQIGMRTIKRELDGAFLLMPTSPHVAPPIAPLEADDDLFHKTNLKTLRNTALGNFLNLPGLAMPNGFGEAGMPTSLLVSTFADDDNRLLVAGIEIEKIMQKTFTQKMETRQ